MPEKAAEKGGRTEPNVREDESRLWGRFIVFLFFKTFLDIHLIAMEKLCSEQEIDEF